MANNTSSNEDPSIEEILDSIRQIISEDDSASEELKPFNSPKEEVPFQSPDLDDDDFMVVADDDLQRKNPVSAPPFVKEDVFELTDKVEEEPVPPIEVDLIDMEDEPEVELEPEDEPQFEAPIYVEDPESILTEAAENAAYDAMTSLVRKTAVEHNGVTLEDIVRSELKPMLRAWLDKNLPIIIERLVREELERVSKRALED